MLVFIKINVSLEYFYFHGSFSIMLLLRNSRSNYNIGIVIPVPPNITVKCCGKKKFYTDYFEVTRREGGGVELCLPQHLVLAVGVPKISTMCSTRLGRAGIELLIFYFREIACIS
jgi:hypothetical protein